MMFWKNILVDTRKHLQYDVVDLNSEIITKKVYYNLSGKKGEKMATSTKSKPKAKPKVKARAKRRSPKKEFGDC